METVTRSKNFRVGPLHIAMVWWKHCYPAGDFREVLNFRVFWDHGKRDKEFGDRCFDVRIGE